MFSLKDKVAVITGARRGIGKGIAEVLASAGASVVISDIDKKQCEKTAEQIKTKYNTDTIAVKCDVSKKKDVEKLMDSAVKQFKKIDILVNNAGVFIQKPFLRFTEDDWKKVIGINLKGSFLCSQAAARHMTKKRYGRIINIASIAGIIAYPNASAYCASKAGIINLTREAALELAPEGINVNAVAPGVIKTKMTEFITKDKKTLNQTLANIPKAKIGSVYDIGYAVLYLAADESDYVTGHTLTVDGGWTIH